MNKVLLFLVLFISSLVSAQATAESAAGVIAVVMLDKTPSGFVVTVNSQVPSKGVLRALIELNADGTRQAALLVHEDASLKRVTDLMGVLSKAGIVSPRVFYFGTDKNWLQEISYSIRFQFSRDIGALKPLPEPARGISPRRAD